MIEPLKVTELAKALNVAQAKVSMWIKRGKLIKGDDKRIDIESPLNKLFLDSIKAEGITLDINRAFDTTFQPIKKTKPKTRKKTITPDPVVSKKIQKEDYSELSEQEVTDIYSMSDANLAREKMRFEVIRLKNADKLDTLKIQKLEGALIPFDAVQHLFTNAISSFHSSYKLSLDSLINVFKQRFEMSHEDTVGLKQELHKALGNTQDYAKTELSKGIKKIVNEYSEVRGRGERK